MSYFIIIYMNKSKLRTHVLKLEFNKTNSNDIHLNKTKQFNNFKNENKELISKIREYHKSNAIIALDSLKSALPEIKGENHFDDDNNTVSIVKSILLNTSITATVEEGSVCVVVSLIIKGIKDNIKELVKCILSTLIHYLYSELYGHVSHHLWERLDSIEKELKKLKISHSFFSSIKKAIKIIKTEIEYSNLQTLEKYLERKVAKNILVKVKRQFSKIYLYPARKTCEYICGKADIDIEGPF